MFIGNSLKFGQICRLKVFASLDEEYYLKFEFSKPKPSYLKPIYLAHKSYPLKHVLWGS